MTIAPEHGPNNAVCSAQAGSRDVNEPVLALQGVSKSFPGVKALRSASLAVNAGEVHALFGENGAGKSTLINIIAGVFRPDDGSIKLCGTEVKFASVQDARKSGVSAMFQEFSLAPDLTVAENLVLGLEPRRGGIFVKQRKARAMASEALRRYGFKVELDAVTCHLSRAEQQLVEMAKAVLTNPRILILDEPTASLSERETEVLFKTIRELKARGTAIIYITHRIREIWEIADRITVMRDGAHVGTLIASEANEDQLIEMMTGRKVEELYPQIPHHNGRPILQINKVSSRDGRVKDVTIELREGEIVGLAGLVGCGKSEIGRLCFGTGSLTSGSIVLDGTQYISATPRQMLDKGLCYITSDRRAEGLLLDRSAQENISLSALSLPEYSIAGLIRSRREPANARALAERVRLRPLDMEARAGNFSGGNQQKVVIARALAVSANVLIFDEPSVGVDVGARAEIYRVLAEIVKEGRSILMISSDLPEILHLCNRVYVVNNGQIADHLTREEISEERILRGFFKEMPAAAAQANESQFQ